MAKETINNMKYFVYALLLWLLVPSTIYGATLANPLKQPSLTAFLTKLLEIIITIGFPLVVLAVVYTGFLFLKAQGNPQELQTARSALFWTLVGALLILGAQVLSLAIQGTVAQITP